MAMTSPNQSTDIQPGDSSRLENVSNPHPRARTYGHHRGLLKCAEMAGEFQTVNSHDDTPTNLILAEDTDEKPTSIFPPLKPSAQSLTRSVKKITHQQDQAKAPKKRKDKTKAKESVSLPPINPLKECNKPMKQPKVPMKLPPITVLKQNQVKVSSKSKNTISVIEKVQQVHGEKSEPSKKAAVFPAEVASNPWASYIPGTITLLSIWKLRKLRELKAKDSLSLPPINPVKEHKKPKPQSKVPSMEQIVKPPTKLPPITIFKQNQVKVISKAKNTNSVIEKIQQVPDEESEPSKKAEVASHPRASYVPGTTTLLSIWKDSKLRELKAEDSFSLPPSAVKEHKKPVPQSKVPIMEQIVKPPTKLPPITVFKQNQVKVISKAKDTIATMEKVQNVSDEELKLSKEAAVSTTEIPSNPSATTLPPIGKDCHLPKLKAKELLSISPIDPLKEHKKPMPHSKVPDTDRIVKQPTKLPLITDFNQNKIKVVLKPKDMIPAVEEEQDVAEQPIPSKKAEVAPIEVPSWQTSCRPPTPPSLPPTPQIYLQATVKPPKRPLSPLPPISSLPKSNKRMTPSQDRMVDPTSKPIRGPHQQELPADDASRCPVPSLDVSFLQIRVPPVPPGRLAPLPPNPKEQLEVTPALEKRVPLPKLSPTSMPNLDTLPEPSSPWPDPLVYIPIPPMVIAARPFHTSPIQPANPTPSPPQTQPKPETQNSAVIKRKKDGILKECKQRKSKIPRFNGLPKPNLDTLPAPSSQGPDPMIYSPKPPKVAESFQTSPVQPTNPIPSPLPTPPKPEAQNTAVTKRKEDGILKKRKQHQSKIPRFVGLPKRHVTFSKTFDIFYIQTSKPVGPSYVDRIKHMVWMVKHTRAKIASNALNRESSMSPIPYVQTPHEPMLTSSRKETTPEPPTVPKPEAKEASKTATAPEPKACFKPAPKPASKCGRKPPKNFLEKNRLAVKTKTSLKKVPKYSMQNNELVVRDKGSEVVSEKAPSVLDRLQVCRDIVASATHKAKKAGLIDDKKEQPRSRIPRYVGPPPKPAPRSILKKPHSAK